MYNLEGQKHLTAKSIQGSDLIGRTDICIEPMRNGMVCEYTGYVPVRGYTEHS